MDRQPRFCPMNKYSKETLCQRIEKEDRVRRNPVRNLWKTRNRRIERLANPVSSGINKVRIARRGRTTRVAANRTAEVNVFAGRGRILHGPYTVSKTNQ